VGLQPRVVGVGTKVGRYCRYLKVCTLPSLAGTGLIRYLRYPTPRGLTSESMNLNAVMQAVGANAPNAPPVQSEKINRLSETRMSCSDQRKRREREFLSIA
jgi:hypothetical protein